MYAEIDDNRFLEVTYANGDKGSHVLQDFNSGAMIQNVVDRAKKNAIKSVLETGQKGLRIQHLLDSIVDEFAENEDLPNTTNPDDWARFRARRASGSCTSARWSPANPQVPAVPSIPSRAWGSTCNTSGHLAAGRRAIGRKRAYLEPIGRLDRVTVGGVPWRMGRPGLTG